MNAYERIQAKLSKHRATMVPRTEEQKAKHAAYMRNYNKGVRTRGKYNPHRAPASSFEGLYVPEDPLKFTRLQSQQPTEYRSNLLNYIHAALTRAEVIAKMRFLMTTEAANSVLLEEGVYFPT